MPEVQYHTYQPFGSLRTLIKCKAPEVMITGPAGTGKSRGYLEKVNWVCEKYPGTRYAMLRKTRKSLTQSTMVTYEKEVMPYPHYVPFHTTDQEYRYPNGSILAVGGLDDPKKILSSQWDGIYIPQAEEATLEDWESLISRLRNGKVPYMQLGGDCNPDVPTHWIPQRASNGMLTLIESRHEDNPVYYDHEKNEWTPAGIEYLSKLDRMTGARLQRLRFGRWTAAEGIVYENWDRAVHLIDRFRAPRDWMRIWVVDFGFTNPFVWQCWVIDPDGCMILEYEIYHTKRTVSDHAAKINELMKGEPKPHVVICDHDAEGRETLGKDLGIKTIAAYKAVSIGIQHVEQRLRKAEDGKPRLLLMRDALVERDEQLRENHLPTCTAEEIDGYVWDLNNNRKKGEEPLKKNDHGCDCIRYGVAYLDNINKVKVTKEEMYGLISVGGSNGRSALSNESDSDGLEWDNPYRFR